MNKNILPAKDDAFFISINYNASSQNIVKCEYNLLLYCVSGSSVVEINYKKYNITPHTTVLLTYQDILMRVYVSTDFKGYCIAFSPNLLVSELAKLDFNFISTMKRNLAINWDGEYAVYIENIFKSIEHSEKFNDKDFTKCTILNQYVCFLNLLKLYFQKNNMMNVDDSNVVSSKKEYFYSFIRELFKFHKQSREVLFYANSLHISSNYLNEICQSISKHSAKELIDYYLSSQLKFELNNTSKSMQELTDEYNFPNQSYFCRYYKRIMGETPTKTRKDRKNNSFIIF